MSMSIRSGCRAISGRRSAGTRTGRTATPTDRHTARQGAAS
ncbi:hypothetical protein [Streptomyces sp. NPDC058773]